VRKEFRGDENVRTICTIVRPRVRYALFLIAEDLKKHMTTVKVTRGVVTVRNLHGARKRTVTVRAGQSATQTGSGVPTAGRSR
jgi:hypothetical protein